MNLMKLIEQLPPDTKKRVVDAKNNYNRLIRESIRFESRLSLNSGKDVEFTEEANAKVTIKCIDAFPDIIENFYIPEEFAVSAMLSQIRPALVQVKKSAKSVCEFVCDIQDMPEIERFVGSAICYADDEAGVLLNLIDKYDLVSELLSFNQDVLGCYKFSITQDHHRTSYTPYREVHLYWGVIGIVASRLGVSIEALTAVVLTHELAHAYTHVGYDIDGNKWSDEGFHQSDPYVIEGLAQYYTERVALRLTLKIPSMQDAFEKLLEKQAEYYHEHRRWNRDFFATPEKVRTALIQGRSIGMLSVIEFHDLLSRQKKV